MLIDTEKQSAIYLIHEAIRKYREKNPLRSQEQALGVLVSKICFETPSEVYEVASSAFEDSNFHAFNSQFENLWKHFNAIKSDQELAEFNKGTLVQQWVDMINEDIKSQLIKDIEKLEATKKKLMKEASK